MDVIDSRSALSCADRTWLEQTLRSACGALGVSGGEVRVEVIDDGAMIAAHERYSGVAGATDVLTFSYADDPRADADVDVMVCVDEAMRQAASRSHGVREELLLYSVHGLLHTLGHDDHDEEAARVMHAEEDRVLTAIGVGAVFASDGGTDESLGVTP